MSGGTRCALSSERTAKGGVVRALKRRVGRLRSTAGDSMSHEKWRKMLADAPVNQPIPKYVKIREWTFRPCQRRLARASGERMGRKLRIYEPNWLMNYSKVLAKSEFKRNPQESPIEVQGSGPAKPSNECFPQFLPARSQNEEKYIGTEYMRNKREKRIVGKEFLCPWTGWPLISTSSASPPLVPFMFVLLWSGRPEAKADEVCEHERTELVALLLYQSILFPTRKLLSEIWTGNRESQAPRELNGDESGTVQRTERAKKV
ncbi:hypothetical protein FB45DRAFT_884036 [Roridomyces roridus]|uniref:Uncharacterized protein n=1 Tax=Roridomyces roridus TaxID=1738132 RepID=A0AAD7F5E4_9AGAR|nr:hypothetical protein FB45DRAFT_884036 [Roridomyces roridus]